MPRNRARLNSALLPSFYISIRWLTAAILLLVLAAGQPTPAAAQAVDNESHNFGGACSGTQNGADWDTIFQCNGATWQRGAYFFGNSSSTCDASHAGLTRYNSGALQYCNASAWTSLTAGCSVPTTTDACQDTFVGTSALPAGGANCATNAIGYDTAFGYQALFTCTGSGCGSNTAVGAQALYNNLSDSNVALGYQAAYNITSGADNVAAGSQALYTSTTGTQLVAIGYRAAYLAPSSWGGAVAVGSQAGYTGGGGDVAIGYQALYNSTIPDGNVAVGYQALFNLTATGFNNAVGYQALYNTTTGTLNNAFGYKALFNNINGSGNDAVGYQAMYSMTANGGSSAVGYQAMYNALNCCQSAMGYQAMYNTTTGVFNNVYGYQALLANVSGSYNSVFGYQAAKNSLGDSNTVFGYQALLTATGGGYNSVFGASSGANITTGTGNTIIGYNAGGTITSGSNNIVIGQTADLPANNTNWLSIGNFIYADMTNQLMGINTNAPAATLDINGFEKLKLYGAAPVTCAAKYRGAIALTHTGYPMCVCNTSNSWVKMTDGTACVW